MKKKNPRIARMDTNNKFVMIRETRGFFQRGYETRAYHSRITHSISRVRPRQKVGAGFTPAL